LTAPSGGEANILKPEKPEAFIMNQNTPNNPPKFSKADRKRILAFTEEMLRRMEEMEVSKTQLANKLEVEPAFISKLIGGENNFTIKTMVKIALALQSRINFSLVPMNFKSGWIVSNFNELELAPIVSTFEPTNRLNRMEQGWRQYEKACTIEGALVPQSYEPVYA
jgi:transcriptional regulator with XRE-family HTH domain